MKALCRHARKCSGCTRLQFPYTKQLRDKDLAVKEELSRFVGGEDSSRILPIMMSPAPLGYRTSTKLCLGEDSFGEPRIGLYERNSKTVVDIPDCPVHQPLVNRVVDRLMRSGVALPAPLYNHAKRAFQPGRLKFLTVRVSPATGESGVVISHTGVADADLKAWLQKVDLKGAAVYGSTLTAANQDLVLSEQISHLAGSETFRYRVGQRDFQLSPLAFFQANFALTDAFVAHIAKGLSGGTLLDLYGGFGPYAFAAATNFQETILVDGSAAAITAAKRTLEEAQKSGETLAIRPVQAFVEDFLAKLSTKAQAGVTHIIVNPPRGGLTPTVRQALSRRTFPALKGVTYVSCSPQTLARDLSDLTSASGLRATQIQAFDMFPQTDHVEVVTELVPR